MNKPVSKADAKLKQEKTRIEMVKREYFDKPNVELFGKTISGSLDFRQEVDKQSSLYLNDMFAIGILDWFVSLYPHATINNENDIEVQAFPIARFIYENSYIASQPYYIIRQYFEWRRREAGRNL